MYVLGYKDLGQYASYSGGSWVVGMEPSSRLASDYLGAIAKTNDATDLTLDITIPTGNTYNIIGVCNHNLTSSGTITYQVFSNSGRTTNVYDSGAIAVDAFPDAVAFPSSLNAFTDQTDIYLRVIISDATNPESFFTIGKIFVGKRFTTALNMMYGAQNSVDNSNTVKAKSTGGVAIYTGFQPIRQVQFNLQHMALTEGDEFYEFMLGTGHFKNVMFQFDEDDSHNGLYTYPGYLEKLTPLQYPIFNRNSAAYQIREMI